MVPVELVAVVAAVELPTTLLVALPGLVTADDPPPGVVVSTVFVLEGGVFMTLSNFNRALADDELANAEAPLPPPTEVRGKEVGVVGRSAEGRATEETPTPLSRFRLPGLRADGCEIPLDFVLVEGVILAVVVNEGCCLVADGLVLGVVGLPAVLPDDFVVPLPLLTPLTTLAFDEIEDATAAFPLLPTEPAAIRFAKLEEDNPELPGWKSKEDFLLTLLLDSLI